MFWWIIGWLLCVPVAYGSLRVFSAWVEPWPADASDKGFMFALSLLLGPGVILGAMITLSCFAFCAVCSRLGRLLP